MKPTRSAEELRDAAWAALDEDPDKAIRLAEQALRRAPDAESHYVLGVARHEAGDDEDAAAALQNAVELDPQHADAWAALARAFFDLARWTEARVAATAALRVDPHHPDAHYTRACLRERTGDLDGAARDYLAAHSEAPGDFPLPVPLDDATISAITDEIIGSLHPSLQNYLDSVAILVDEFPAQDILDEFEPRARPAELLGSFSGQPLPDRASGAPWTSLPATIVLYRKNLERIASNRDDVLDQLRITLLHEIGHFLGLDEEDLAARGLD